jgi:DNA-binding NarL/FixJ family response regulator
MRILLADDQAKVRSALRLLLEQEPELEILGEAVDTTGLLDWLKVADPEVLLFDWELPGLSAAKLVQQVRSQRPDLQMIAMSGLPEARQSALEAGIHAFVSKGDPPEVLVATIRACCRQNATVLEQGGGHDQRQ